MELVCVHCDHHFRSPETEAPKRCPACMRAGGIQQRGAAASPVAPAAKSSARWLALGLVVAVLAGVGGVLWYRAGRGGAPTAGDGALDRDALAAALASEQVQEPALAGLLTAGEKTRALAQRVVKGERGPVAIADALAAHLKQRKSALAFVPWSLAEPRPTAVRTPDEVTGMLMEDRGRFEPYPAELALWLLSALRELDVSARIAELYEPAGQVAPLDPSGYLGYYVVAVPDGAGGSRLYDTYAGRVLEAASNKHEVLPDTAAVGVFLSLRALHEVTYLADPRRALESSGSALRLAGRVPAVRSTHGLVVLGAKMVEQGLQEFEAARQLRPDAPRLHNVAGVLLATGEVGKAESLLHGALQLAPDFAAARASLAAVLLMRGEGERAFAELTRAEELAPSLSLVQWGFAEYFLRTGDREQALMRARRAYGSRPSSDAKLRLAVILYQTGKLEEMRALAAQLYQGAPAYHRDDTRDLLKAVLGPTALLDLEPADPTAKDLSDLGGPAVQLSEMLGESGTAVPSTLGEPEALGQPLNSDGDAPKLRLRDKGDTLRLRLGDE